jgi:hypothetical protein
MALICFLSADGQGVVFRYLLVGKGIVRMEFGTPQTRSECTRSGTDGGCCALRMRRSSVGELRCSHGN